MASTASTEPMSAAPPSAPPSASPETREQLIATALRIFAGRGYDGASTRDIARASGVALSAISYHFGSKPELYAAVADRAATVMFAPIEARVARAEAIAAARPTLEEARDALVLLVDAVAVALLATGHEAEVANQFGMRELATGGPEAERIHRGVVEPIVTAAAALLAAAPGGERRDHGLVATTLFGPITLVRLLHNRSLGDMASAQAEGLLATVRAVSKRNAMILFDK